MHPLSASARPALLLAASVLLAACAGAGPAIGISGAWARPPLAEGGPAAAYLVVENRGPAADALLGASSPIAGSVEVHETFELGAGDPAASDGAMGGGMMGMRPVDRLEIPAGGRVELRPGGHHLMLVGLRGPLAPGSSIELTLRFERAGDVTVSVPVRS